MDKDAVLKSIIADLSVNYNPLKNDEKQEKAILSEILDEVERIALSISHQKNSKNLISFIKTATKSLYIRRGKEGETSNNEGSQNASYEDIMDKLEKDIIYSGNRRVK